MSKKNRYNQILVNKKKYESKESKRKKKINLIEVTISVILTISLLIGYLIYLFVIENNDEASKILRSLEQENNQLQDDSSQYQGFILQDVLKINLDAKEDQIDEIEENTESVGPNPSEEDSIVTRPQTTNSQTTRTVVTQSGNTYVTNAQISIPAINCNLPILLPNEMTIESIEQTLKSSCVKFWGPEPNQVGNYCIVGHNYRNSKFFSKVPKLNIGDRVIITDMTNTQVIYTVYDKYTVDSSDNSCTDQRTQGGREVTLITCTDDGKLRYIVKCRE